MMTIETKYIFFESLLNGEGEVVPKSSLFNEKIIHCTMMMYKKCVKTHYQKATEKN